MHNASARESFQGPQWCSVNLIIHYCKFTVRDNYAPCSSTASLLLTFLLNTKLNSGPLYSNQVIGSVSSATYNKLVEWSNSSCSNIKSKDEYMWEQTYVGFYKSDEKTAYTCFLYPVVWQAAVSHLPVLLAVIMLPPFPSTPDVPVNQ